MTTKRSNGTTSKISNGYLSSDEEFEELGPLVAMELTSGQEDLLDKDPQFCGNLLPKLPWLLALMLLIVALYVMAPTTGSKNSTTTMHHHNHHHIHLECPTEPLSTLNFDDDAAIQDYVANGTQPCTKTPACFLETFRDHVFDGHTRTYTQFKESEREFVRDFFVPHLKPGDAIYESACGIGLNLFAVLELVAEEANLTGITVYGNEYIEENANRANWILDVLLGAQLDEDMPNKKGHVCRGDSTDLSFVPANSFDLVYTGFISPLWDPLHINSHSKMKELCLDQNKNDDWKAQTLVNLSQSMQDDWFSQWVVEMIRIAKPGAPIIIEENALPFCSNPHDYGGVSPAYWHHGVDHYGWNVQPSSLQFGKRGNGYKGSRYHVFMLKKEEE
ncbi:expressed unknown protein [Seminavis robusta]|uniref:Uncharacterized protein n=1 Tax=Seminavis robusta TaxID=568900 RepID=A0A9N8DVZ9_9STRA|nr:expressed unknown protein [Seminavis robusta]|eukprot:Sro393_g133480.1 n/a (389) ;mRNA; f:4491-5824